MIKKTIKQIADLAGYKIIKLEKDKYIDKHLKNDDMQRLSDNYNKYLPLKIHFGCGPRILKGWVNIDLIFEPYQNYLSSYTDKYYHEDIRGDKFDFYAIDIIKNGLALPDNSVDIIFHEDFIEHLNQRDQMIFFAETYRILKPGAIHRVNTPNLLGSMRTNSDLSQGFTGVYKDEWDNWHHKNLLTPELLKEISHMIGYSDVIFNSRDHSVSSEIPLEYRPAGDRNEIDGNIFADLIK